TALGDKLTRDGYHLTYTTGRMAAALTWYAYFVDEDISGVTYTCSKDVTPEILNVIKSSISDALMKPFEITEQ
ncbi:MAG: DUF4886 domain-containing protein, partial [Clostridiales bacterium]|nr:DUF4886 domain-containing protein [Clostridiales bacterium]